MSEYRDDPEIFWVDPKMRGILPLDDFHIPKRLRRTVRQNRFEIRCNRAFPAVIAACAQSGEGRQDTWINTEIEQAVIDLHQMGHAHSIECWRDGKLVGGLYGIALGAAFFGESMFSRTTNASKVALVHLVARLRQGGFRLLDTQFVTKHLKRFGAIEIPAHDYLQHLEDALKFEAQFNADDEQIAEALNHLLDLS